MTDPLKIAVIVKPSPSTTRRDDRNMGMWSYPVPEFEWDFSSLGNGFLERRVSFHDYDLIFIEDGGNWGKFLGENGPRIVYYSIDSTLTDAHYQKRLRQASFSDLVLVDHDKPARFKASGRPVVQVPFCVNDRLFAPREKTIDVCFHCGAGASNPGGPARTAMRQTLDDICARHGWSYVSGAKGLDEYALHMGQAKVVVNIPRTPINRPHRVHDAMASGAALLTAPIPWIAEDKIEPSKHYRVIGDLERDLIDLLDNGKWQELADRGHNVNQAFHTWAHRAQEMRALFAERWGL